MKIIQASAPAKVHIIGEHSVVYGKPAILAAINLRVTAKIQNSEFTIKNNEKKTVLQNVVEKIVKREFKIKQIPQYQVEIHSEIPVGCGLGSSAAVSSAYIACLLIFLKKSWDVNLINKLTFEAEKVFHGNPSGGDNAAVVFGNAIWFRKETDFLNTITTFPIKKTKAVLIDSGKPSETTREMVEFVRLQIKKSKKNIEIIFSNQEEIARKIAVSFYENDITKLKQLITHAQRNLEKLGVVGKRAKKIIRILETQGFSAKIVGAGGRKTGSGMIVCIDKDTSRVISFAKKNGLKAFEVSLGEEGVRKEV